MIEADPGQDLGGEATARTIDGGRKADPGAEREGEDLGVGRGRGGGGEAVVGVGVGVRVRVGAGGGRGRGKVVRRQDVTNQGKN